tara:strand:- start:84 stop:395 length:312 start_codon:yes stop_codon:yes gene_type:complete
VSDLGKIAGLPEELGIGESIAKKGVEITVTIEKMRYRKLMTVVSGLKDSGMDLHQLASDLKRKFACGGTVSDRKEILLQGDHRAKIRRALVKLGFEEDSINIK